MRWFVSCTSRKPYTCWHSLPCPQNERLGGPHCRYERFANRKMPCLSQESKLYYSVSRLKPSLSTECNIPALNSKKKNTFINPILTFKCPVDLEKIHVFASTFVLVINQLDAQNLFYNKFISCLYMFLAPCAHCQEVKILLYSLWCHHTYRWPSGAQVERGLIGIHAFQPVLSQPVHGTATYSCDDTRGCII